VEWASNNKGKIQYDAVIDRPRLWPVVASVSLFGSKDDPPLQWETGETEVTPTSVS